MNQKIRNYKLFWNSPKDAWKILTQGADPQSVIKFSLYNSTKTNFIHKKIQPMWIESLQGDEEAIFVQVLFKQPGE